MPIDLLSATMPSAASNAPVDLLAHTDSGIENQADAPKKKSFDLIDVINTFGGNIARGLLWPEQQAVNAAGYAGQKLLGKPSSAIIPSLEPYAPDATKDVEQNYPTVAQGGQVAGSLLSPLPMVKAGDALIKGGTAAKDIAKSYLNTGATGAGVGLLGALGSNQSAGDTAEAAGKGAGYSTAIATLLGVPQLTKLGLGKLVQANSREPISTIQSNADKLAGMPASAGDIAESPGFSKFYNDILSAIPGTGVSANQAKLVSAADEASKAVIDHFTGGEDPSNIPLNISNAVKANADKAEKTTEDNYNKFLNTADDEGLRVTNRPQSQQFAQDELDRIAKLAPQDTSNISSATVKILKKIAKPYSSNSNSIFGAASKSDTENSVFDKPAPDYSVKNAVTTSNSIGEMSAAAYAKGNNTEGKLLRELELKLKSDVGDYVKNTGSPNLVSQWDTADKYHENNVIPYRNQAIRNIAKGDFNEKSLASTLLNGKNDQVLQDLPQDIKRQVAFQQLLTNIKESPEGELQQTPSILFNGYNKLTPLQKNRLLTDDDQDLFRQLGAIGNVSKEARLQVSNPANGFRANRSLLKGFLSGAAGAVGAHFLPATTLTIGAGVPLAARGFASLLRNPDVINATAGRGLFNPNIPQRGANLITKGLLFNQ